MFVLGTSLCVCMCVPLQLFPILQLCLTPRTVVHLAPLSVGFSRQEYWHGLLFPPPGNTIMGQKLLFLSTYFSKGIPLSFVFWLLLRKQLHFFEDIVFKYCLLWFLLTFLYAENGYWNEYGMHFFLFILLRTYCITWTSTLCLSSVLEIFSYYLFQYCSYSVLSLLCWNSNWMYNHNG